MDQDPKNNARAAREGLARGLALLQDPNLPVEMSNAAEPIARAMGALLQAERTDGRARSIRPHAEAALASAREALAKLQGVPTGNPVAENVMAAVAGSLGVVHALSRLQSSPPPPQAPAPFAPPAATYAQPPAAPPPYVPPQATIAQPPPYVPPQATMAQPPAYVAPAAPAAPPAAPARSGDSIAPPPGAIEAALGAHSTSNFYKTLSGNDIVDHGGIFVATYAIPKMGAQVAIRIHLPGGYHFDCQGAVRWTREQRDNPDAPPGFGAQMLGITAEQRQLIMRYVRNREPLFYDDL